MNEDLKILKNIIRTGAVESVDLKSGTARVRFADKDNLLSSPLKVMKNSPMIVIEKEVDGESWDVTAEYATVERLKMPGMTFNKSDHDTVTLSKTIQYEKKNAIPDSSGCNYVGVIGEKTHKHTVKIYSWMPYIGQNVICVYLPIGNGDGFVIGGV